MGVGRVWGAGESNSRLLKIVLDFPLIYLSCIPHPPWAKSCLRLWKCLLLISNINCLSLHFYQVHRQTGARVGLYILVPLLASITGTSNLFTCCFFGKIASSSFERLADFIYGVNWHSLPLELQKYVILMLSDAQRPLYFHGNMYSVAFLLINLIHTWKFKSFMTGYRIAVLNLETFCTVSKKHLL